MKATLSPVRTLVRIEPYKRWDGQSVQRVFAHTNATKHIVEEFRQLLLDVDRRMREQQLGVPRNSTFRLSLEVDVIELLANEEELP